MFKKNAVLIGVILSLVLMLIAISKYPGGTMFDPFTVGFDWKKNFISNLFGARALNGTENTSRYWAWTGMLLLPTSYAICFFNMADKIPDRNAGIILKFGAVANIVANVLTVTWLHDSMLIISTSLFWTCLLVVTVFIFKTKLHLFKFLCAACLVMFYYSVYLWAISDWDILPVTQKINVATSTMLIILFEYFTSKEDFANIKSKGKRELESLVTHRKNQ